jgi:trehalose 6-phosphate phosphatase
LGIELPEITGGNRVKHEHWGGALDTMVGAHRPLVALDFDGTLAPFQLDSSKSRIPATGVKVLTRLVTVPELALAMITGRTLEDLLSVAQLPAGTRLVGDHGVQFGYLDDSGPVLDPVDLTSQQRQMLLALTDALGELVRDGAWIEHKTTSVVFQTRPMASRDEAAGLREQARAIGHALGAAVLDGKEMVELGIVHADKGEALARLREGHRAGIVLFAGDDVTDESAFRTLTRDDIGIKVGAGPSAARLRADGPDDLIVFLADLADRFGV